MKRWVVAVCFIVALTAFGGDFQAGVAVPKLCPTQSVIVLDVSDDKKNGGNDFATDSHDVIAAIKVFQGLINRNSSEKVFLTHLPARLYWNTAAAGEPGDPAELQLQDALIPCEIRRPELARSKKYPALSYLLLHYRHLLKGKILAPPEENPWPEGVARFHQMYNNKKSPAVFKQTGARIAALTACGFEDALLVSPAVEAYLQSEGIDLPLIADTRSMQRIEAFHWMCERYLNRPDRNRTMIAFHDNKSFLSPNMHDYWVATRTFCVFLLQKENAEEKRLLEELLSGDHFDPGAPFFGSIEGSGAGNIGTKFSHPPVYGTLMNATVTSSFKLEPHDFPQPRQGKALELVPRAVYIVFNGSDGDALDWAEIIIYKDLRAKQDATPSAFRLNAYLIDLYPTLVKWFLEQAESKQVDIVWNSVDGGLPKQATGLAAMRKHWADYAAAVNGNFRLHHIFNSADSAETAEVLGDVETDLVICGYQGPTRGPYRRICQFSRKGNTLFATQIGNNYMTVRTLYKMVEEAVVAAPADKPLFLVVRGGHAQGIGTAAMFDETARKLTHQGVAGRPVFILSPADFAATAKSLMSLN